MPLPDRTITQWRALGVDWTEDGRVVEPLGPVAGSVDELDLTNDAEPPYQEIIVQRRTLTPWEDVPAPELSREGRPS